MNKNDVINVLVILELFAFVYFSYTLNFMVIWLPLIVILAIDAKAYFNNNEDDVFVDVDISFKLKTSYLLGICFLALLVMLFKS